MTSTAVLADLHREIRSCTRCVNAGYLAAAAPVLSGHADNRIILIGQAPGAVEAVAERFLPGRRVAPLVGRAFDLSGGELGLRTATRPVLLPLPHPSGASRWLNDVGHRALLDQALRRLRPLVRPLLDQPIAGAYTSPQHAGGPRARRRRA